MSTLHWTSEPGKTYRVQFKTSLAENSWNDLAGDVTASDVMASKADVTAVETRQRFYRSSSCRKWSKVSGLRLVSEAAKMFGFVR